MRTGKYFLNRPSAALAGVIFARSDERKKPRNVHKTVGTGKIGQERKNRSNLRQEVREVGRKQFKAAKTVAPPEKSLALAKKFQAHYNKNGGGRGEGSQYG